MSLSCQAQSTFDALVFAPQRGPDPSVALGRYGSEGFLKGYMMMTKPVLVTGSTGYVGGRLVPKLLESGYRVRALGRSTAKLKARPWANHPLVELAAGDVLDYDLKNAIN